MELRKEKLRVFLINAGSLWLKFCLKSLLAFVNLGVISIFFGQILQKMQIQGKQNNIWICQFIEWAFWAAEEV